MGGRTKYWQILTKQRAQNRIDLKVIVLRIFYYIGSRQIWGQAKSAKYREKKLLTERLSIIDLLGVPHGMRST